MKPEPKAAAKRRIAATKRAYAALRPTHPPEDPLTAPPADKGLGWWASWYSPWNGSSLRELTGRGFNEMGGCFRLPRAAPTEPLPPRPSGSQGARPLFDTRLAALLWVRGQAERNFGAVLAEIDEAITKEQAAPTDDGWTLEAAERYTSWR